MSSQDGGYLAGIMTYKEHSEMRKTLFTLSLLLIAAAAPAVAQDAMAKHDGMQAETPKMSAADTREMKACNAMSHDKMMKNAGCKKLAAANPDMMKHDAMQPAH
ncbi:MULTISPECIES: hypothetical protein [Sphingosinicellaceae]|uniref:hypothetical protein n=1 Tax=Sphingosinicellaceae TaxID=2820280 RepID=UPI001C1E24F5|nr:MULTISPECIES: hypothetical protein [Polymorphobacter]QYE35649.1 hypothetical protein KZX46_06650 [Polymorphobacter sp. PAMC 29334]UAJ10986.1 hypothetical protein KTC28_04525 [Polymorphobacter megasporae]